MHLRSASEEITVVGNEADAKAGDKPEEERQARMIDVLESASGLDLDGDKLVAGEYQDPVSALADLVSCRVNELFLASCYGGAHAESQVKRRALSLKLCFPVHQVLVSCPPPIHVHNSL